MKTWQPSRRLRPVLHFGAMLFTNLALLAFVLWLRSSSMALVSAARVQAAGPEAAPQRFRSSASSLQAEVPALPLASLELGVDPTQAWPGQVVTVTTRVRVEADLAQVEWNTVLPTGLTFEAVQGPDASYDPNTRRLLWRPLSPQAGTTLEMRFQVRVGDDAPDLTVLQAQLQVPGYSHTDTGRAVVKRLFPPSETVITPDGGELRSADGRVRVIFPAGAVTQSVRVEHRALGVERLAPRRGGLALQFALNAFSADVNAVPVRQFARPLELQVDLAGLADPYALALYQQLFLAYRDAEQEAWIPLRTRALGAVMTAQCEHFSYFGGGVANQEVTGWVLAYNDAQVATFNGGLTYDYPIEAPPGRGGLTPDLRLSYNSRRVDGLLTWVQSDWAGLGWTVDSMSIVRAVTPTADWRWGYVNWANAFTLLYKGTGYRLVPGTANPYGRYYTEDEQFLYVERRNALAGNGSGGNNTSEYWLVRLRDGTECRLGHNYNSEQIVTTNYYDADPGDPCFWSGGSPPISATCYAGNAMNTVTFQWRVDAMTDTHGNTIQLTYVEESQADPTRDRASYVSEIRYNYLNTAPVRPGTLITLTRAARSSDSVSDTVSANSLFFYQSDYLRSIKVSNWDGSQYKVIREYSLTYDARNVPVGEHDNNTRRLASIRDFGSGGISGGNGLPTTTLGYEVYQNKGICYSFWGGECTDGLHDDWDQEGFRYERLVTLTNGYGGVTTVSYGKADDEDDWWQAWNWRVAQKAVSDGQSGGRSSAYHYTTAITTGRCYDNNNTYGCDPGITQPGGALIGYANVTETLKTAGGLTVAITAHAFKLNSEADPNRALGRELVLQRQDAAGADLQKTVTTWAVVPGSHGSTYFVHAQWIEEYLREGGGLPANPQKATRHEYETTRQGGAQYGNLTLVREQQGGAIYRQTLNHYVPNTSTWIVGRPVSTVLSYGTDAVQNVTQYVYDYITSTYQAPPVRGDLAVVSRTITVTPSYGWITETTVYTNAASYYLPIETADGEGRKTRTGYDTLWKLYPITVSQVLNPSNPNANLVVTYQHSYTLGRVTVMTSTNGGVTSYVYDVWGRATKVVRPGDSSSYPSVLYEYCDTCSPLRIVTKARPVSGQSATLPTIRFYNGLGQLIEENGGTSDSSQMTVAHHAYNAQGLKSHAYAPYFAAFSWNYVALDASKPKTSYAYDALGRTTVVTNSDGTAARTAYQGLSNAVVDEKGHQTLYGSDFLGRLVTVTECSGTYGAPTFSPTAYATTLYGYNPLDGLARVTDTLGNTTVITYDALGRKTAMRDPDMGLWTYTYDKSGSLTRQTDARGLDIIFAYDLANRLTGKQYPSGQDMTSVAYGYDQGSFGKGYRAVMSDGSGSTRWLYDARGRVVSETKTITGAGGALTTLWTYDALDRVATVKYPDNETVGAAYTTLGWPNSLTGTLSGQFTNFAYVTGTTYNALGLPRQFSLGSAAVTGFSYWGLGGDADSHPSLGTTNFGRLLGLRTTITTGVPLQDLRYNYDAAGNVGRVAYMPLQASGWPTSGFSVLDTFDVSSTVTFTYSSRQTVPYNDGGSNVCKSSGTGSNYDAHFYRSAYSLVSGEGLTLTFKVDVTNTSTHLSIEADDATYRRFGVIADKAKLYVQIMDGSTNRYPADLLTNLLTNTWYVLRIVVSDTNGFYVEAYQRDAPAVRGSYNAWMPTGKSWRFHHWIWRGNAYIDSYAEFSSAGLTWTPNDWLDAGYDELDRLTGIAPVSGWQGYTGTYDYNAIGNLTSKTENGVTWVYTYPDSGAGSVRPHAVTSLSNGWSYTYDADGNQTQRAVAAGTYVLTYNLENQLVRVSGPVTAAFGYDGDGKLVTATTSGTTTFYMGNYYEKTGSTVRKYYYHAGRRVAMREGNTLSWLLTDQLGSTAMTLTASAAITGELRYKAYGETRYAYGTTSTKYRFTGQREESTIGLYFYNSRWYDAVLGRFVQADTIVPQPGNPQALNRYSYVLNNPLTRPDPTGHVADEGTGGGADYLWWKLFHPDMPKWWWIWYYASGKLKNLVGAGTFSQYGQDIVAEAAHYDIPAADLFGIVRQEAPNPTKPLAFVAALAGKDTTIGLTEVSVPTALKLTEAKVLSGPRGRTQLVLSLGLSGRYSIRAAAAAYKQASDVAREELPGLPDSLRQYYVLAMYNQGQAETLAELHKHGAGAFTPEAVEYIHYVRQYSPEQREMQFWALVSNIVEFAGGARW